MLLRFADGPALSGPNVGLRISDDVALLWLLLDGSPMDVVARRAAEATDGRIRPSEVEAATEQLRRFGAVEAAGV